MSINVDGIKNHLRHAYQFVINQYGKLAGHTVRILTPILAHIRQDARLAFGTVVVANVIFFEITYLITSLANKILVRLFGSEDQLSERSIGIRAFVLLSFASSLFVGMNMVLHRTLQPSLSPFVSTAVSTTACVGMILFHMWRASGNKEDVKKKEVM